MWSLIEASLLAIARDGLDDGPAKFRRTVAAIFHQIGEQVAEAGHVGDVADDAAVALGADQTSMVKHLQMRRHRVLHRAKSMRSRRRARRRPGPNEQPEDLEPGVLTEGGERCEGRLLVQYPKSKNRQIYLRAGRNSLMTSFGGLGLEAAALQTER